jgi:hypothetical protein
LAVDADRTDPLDRGHTATMKALRFLLLAAVASPVVVAAAELARGRAIEFCDEELSLALVETMPDGSVFNGYLRTDETPEDWHVMVALRHHPAATLEEIVRRWRAHVAQLPASGTVLKEYQHNTPQDQRFTLALHDETDSTLELDAVRFVPDATGRGVCFYEAAVRVKDEKSPRAVEEALERQQEFAEALPKLTLEPVTRLVPHTDDDHPHDDAGKAPTASAAPPPASAPDRTN